jgi:hypothetical protein
MNEFCHRLRLLSSVLLLVVISSYGSAQPVATSVTFDQSHQAFTRLLEQYVSPAGLVDYAALQADPEMLTGYLQSLSEVDNAALLAQDGAVQIAFWINAYNAITLQAIIDHYPIPAGGAFGGLFGGGQSITNIDGVWDELQWSVAGQQLTLDAIEHNILRKEFSEPRIHFAIVCASLSCPDLRREAYSGLRLQRQLQEQTLRFLNNPSKGLNIDRGRERVSVSAIFDWFDEDFDCEEEPLQIAAKLSGKRRSVACFIASQLLPSDPRREYLLQENYNLRFLNYDWSLNGQR